MYPWLDMKGRQSWKKKTDFSNRGVQCDESVLEIGVDLGALAQFGVSKSSSNLACMLADLQPFGSESIYS